MRLLCFFVAKTHMSTVTTEFNLQEEMAVSPLTRDYRVFSWLNVMGRLVLAAVFLFAGGLKIVDPLGFARNIADYDLVPEALVPVIAVVLPWWEVAAGVLALAGRWKIGALTVLTGLSAAFFVLGGITLARGMSVECGCFGSLSERVGPLSLSIEAALTVVGVLLLRWEMRHGNPREQEPRRNPDRGGARKSRAKHAKRR